MIATVQHLWCRMGFGKPKAPPRSRKWPHVEACAALRDGLRCRACGRTYHTVRLVGHHIIPFHKRPDLELDLDNIITLCQGLGGGCHLRLGHTDELGRTAWKYWNPNVVAQADEERKKWGNKP